MPGLLNRKKKAYLRAYYEKNKDELEQALRETYKADPSKRQNNLTRLTGARSFRLRKSYEADPSKKLQAQKNLMRPTQASKREAERNRYDADPSRKQRTGTTPILFQRKLQMWCITTKTLCNVSAQCRIITDGAVRVCC